MDANELILWMLLLVVLVDLVTGGSDDDRLIR